MGQYERTGSMYGDRRRDLILTKHKHLKISHFAGLQTPSMPNLILPEYLGIKTIEERVVVLYNRVLARLENHGITLIKYLHFT
jgi:hypothetical protein